MNTIVYFVRHAESPFIEGMNRTRGLSEKGMSDALRVAAILKHEAIDMYISSPYERAVCTIQEAVGSKEIIIYEDLRERNIGKIGGISFKEAKRRVYDDPSLAYPDGESSLEAQKRAADVIKSILVQYVGMRIAVGTHGDIMTLILNDIDKQFDYEFWESTTMPDIYRVEFEGMNIIQTARLWE